ncbi:E-selectin-like [Halichondria panicea]|uniref:E-selectin-like n=1 Tax=Halichondria panicea TaxID=6063 RepID=UPI00312B475E
MDNSLVNEGNMEVATFNCFKGYRLNGPSTIYYEEGYWSEEFVPECKPVDCGAPEAPLNGIVEFKDTHFMATAHYKCDACHIRNGYEQRNCKPSGLWSKSVPECVLMNDILRCAQYLTLRYLNKGLFLKIVT